MSDRRRDLEQRLERFVSHAPHRDLHLKASDDDLQRAVENMEREAERTQRFGKMSTPDGIVLEPIDDQTG